MIQVYAFPKAQQLMLRGIISFLCTLILGLHLRLQPFKEKWSNYLETGLLIILCLISTLSTISTQQSITGIKAFITVLAALPLLPVFPLGWKYLRRTVVPKLGKAVSRKSQSQRRIGPMQSAGRQSQSQRGYVPPTPQTNIDEDIGNTKKLVEDGGTL